MALIYCRERSGRSGSSAGLFETEMSRTWQLKTDIRNDNVYLYIKALQESGDLPLQYAPHPFNIFATCRRMSVNDDASGMLYTIKADYSAKPLSQDDRNRAETPNPLDRRPRRWIESFEYEIYTNKNRDGKVIANSAGSPYPEPAVIPAADYVVQVRQNFTEWPEWIDDYNNKLNEEDLIIRPTGISKSRTLKAETTIFKYQGCSEPKEEFGKIYVEISYRLHYRKNGWQDSRVDKGFYYKAPKNDPDDDDEPEPDLQRIQIGGEDSVEEMPLDGDGGVLTNPTPSTIVLNDEDVIDMVIMTELAVLNT